MLRQRVEGQRSDVLQRAMSIRRGGRNGDHTEHGISERVKQQLHGSSKRKKRKKKEGKNRRRKQDKTHQTRRRCGFGNEVERLGRIWQLTDVAVERGQPGPKAVRPESGKYWG